MRQGEFYLASNDVLLGEVEGVPFYTGAAQAELLRLHDETAGGADTTAERAVVEADLARLRAEHAQLKADIFASLTPFDRVQLARHPDRPYTLDYISMICTDFNELHGDRPFVGFDKQIKEGKPFGTESGKIEIYSKYLDNEANRGKAKHYDSRGRFMNIYPATGVHSPRCRCIRMP